ncbi:MAG: hypothetical protein ACD_10C00570G0001 [uncultured bacterium]|nr:MAG: hypothetical protein ACD_10C00570G0001 [uncultured bacterium]
MRFVGKNNAGWRVMKDFLCQLFAFGTGPALRDVGINCNEAAIGQGDAANIQRLAIRPCPFDMMRLRMAGPSH